MRIILILFLSATFACSRSVPELIKPAEVSKEHWFTIETDDDFSPSEIDAHDWLHIPAGKHGFVTYNGDQFAFEDGTPVKFWGVNMAEYRAFTSSEEADQFARFWSKYGVNAVRFHKITWDLTRGMHQSVLTNPELFDMLDYFSARLRDHGIYYGWSHIYGHRVLPGDSARLLAYEEIKNLGGSHLAGSTYNLVYFAPDLQDLSIELTVNMLNHVNPYTGLRYADDPALNFVELNNEDNLFWASAHNRILAAPTYKKFLKQKFSQWLLEKYGSHEGLLAAWGQTAMDAFPDASTGEHLDKENIYPIAHHYFLSTEYIENHPEMRRRIWDSARFLYEVQVDFYDRFVKAVRETGYKGPIVTSCWQAGDNIAHYYNLHSDYLFGFIDRHNYFGGASAGDRAMVDLPGTGLLSSGLQQIANRPFAFSEWMSIMPNPWLAESVPLIAIYGLGLQGWDASFAYASNQPSLTNSLHAPRHGVYNADSPLHMGLYPAMSRLVYRGDVQQAEVLTRRNVYIPGLIDGKIGFTEQVAQDHDIKEFEGSVPREALAIGRNLIEFTEEPKETIIPEFSDYWDEVNNIVRSTTGQLEWNYANRGFITINTPGTVGFIGFPPDTTFTVGEYHFRTSNEFAVVFLTSLEKDKTLKNARRILVSAFARAENTGAVVDETTTRYIEQGVEPILMEPVNLSMSFPNIGRFNSFVLDIQGRRTGVNVQHNDRQLMLNGSEFRANYYLMER